MTSLPPTKLARTVRIAAAMLALAALFGCTGERFAANRAEPPPPAAPPPPPPKPPPPPVDMAGRWVLTGASGGSCAMTFGGSTGAAEGPIAPAGGCPGNFFTSRKWTYEQDALIVRDHKGQPLAQLKLSAAGRFEGQSTNGATVSLAR